MSDIEKVKTFCSNCNKETNQIIIFREKKVQPSEIIGRNESGSEKKSLWYLEESNWDITRCNGCESLNLKITTRHLGSEIINEINYPSQRIRSYPKWIIDLPMEYVDLLLEVYSALNKKLFRLALMGARTIIDIYMLNKVGDIGSFKSKLEALVKEGVISTIGKEILEASIDAGNAAAHRGYKPDEDTLNKVLDIIENVIQNEVLHRDAQNIKKITPKRK